MSQNGYCSDSFVAKRRRQRKENYQSFTCISPRFIFSRWLGGNKSKDSRNRMERKWEKNEKIEPNLDIERNGKSGVVKGSISNHGASPSSYDSETGKEASFNLGVGLGLIYLVAASRNEVKKIVEMHKRMEMLLHNLQTEVQNQEKKSILKPSLSESSHHSLSSSTVVEHSPEYPHQEHDSTQFSSSQYIKRPEIGILNNHYRRGNSLRMDRLEAELATEFDRLQLQMDTNFFQNYPKPQYSEMVGTVVEVAAKDHQCLDGEVVNEQPPINEFYAVPPRELERRLHQVLEERQQERINELESSLERAMHQLEEKEKELSWWKDTASVISRQLPRLLTTREAKDPFLINRDGARILSLGYEKRFGAAK